MLTTANQFRSYSDDGHRCIHCRWVEVKVRPTSRGLGCLCPKCLYGQAGEGKSCCSWEREPGADDENYEPEQVADGPESRLLSLLSKTRAVVRGRDIAGMK